MNLHEVCLAAQLAKSNNSADLSDYYTKSQTDGLISGKVDKAETALNRSTLGYQRKNLLKNTAVSKTTNGVTFTVNGDGSITTDGTSTGVVDYIIGKYLFENGVKYTLSGCPSGGTASTYVLRVYGLSSGSSSSTSDYGNGVEFVGDGNTHDIRIVIGNRVNMNSDFYPMLRYTEITDDTYEQYMPSVKEYISDLEARITALEGSTSVQNINQNQEEN